MRPAFYLLKLRASRRHSVALILAVAVCVCLNATAATKRLGHSYMPTPDYTIFSIQGIDSSNLFGDGNPLSQVNTDFEFTGGIGVSYDPGTGKLTDFGIGLYQNTAHQTKSTGLLIHLTTPTDAAHVTITLADFDINATSTFFNPNKVEPRIILFGPTGTVYANAGPTDIFHLLTVNTTSSIKGKGAPDVWDLNFGQLLTSLHMPDTNITGYQLYADASSGNKVPSDPYFFVSQKIVSP
jgi:hypothetical protein